MQSLEKKASPQGGNVGEKGREGSKKLGGLSAGLAEPIQKDSGRTRVLPDLVKAWLREIDTAQSDNSTGLDSLSKEKKEDVAFKMQVIATYGNLLGPALLDNDVY